MDVPVPHDRHTSPSASAFSDELGFRVVEATASLQAAEALADDLTAQIAAADLADLRSLAARNDVPHPVVDLTGGTTVQPDQTADQPA